MKKLNLNVADFGATEILSREELKKVLGGTETGSGSGSGSGGCSNYTIKANCKEFACWSSTVDTGKCQWKDNACTCVAV